MANILALIPVTVINVNNAQPYWWKGSTINVCHFTTFVTEILIVATEFHALKET